jgi:hypothetical protein
MVIQIGTCIVGKHHDSIPFEHVAWCSGIHRFFMHRQGHYIGHSAAGPGRLRMGTGVDADGIKKRIILLSLERDTGVNHREERNGCIFGSRSSSASSICPEIRDKHFN